MTEVNLDALVGLTVEAAYRAEEDIWLVSIDGRTVRLRPHGDCCAYCYVAGATLTDALLVATISSIEDLGVDSVQAEADDYGETVDTFGHRFHTSRGTCTLDMRTEHNGYYSGWLCATLDAGNVPEGAKPLVDF